MRFSQPVSKQWLGAAILALVSTASPAFGQEVALSIRAGLGGVARPGRWMPLLVTLESQSAIEGDVLVEWGSSRIVHALRLSPGMPRHLNLFIRATDVRGAISTRFTSDRRAVASATVPIHLSATDAPVTVCTTALPDSAVSCTVSVTEMSAPVDWRGYDAADRVEPDGVPASFNANQRTALSLWKRARELEESGTATIAGNVPDTVPPGLRHAGILLAFPGALALAALGSRFVPRRAFAAGIALLGASVGATVATLLIDRSSTIAVHHASTLEAFEGSEVALLLMRAVATFPSSGVFALTGEASSQVLDRTSFGQAPLDEQFDERGRPLLAGRFGLGERAPFSLSGSARAVLTAESTGTGVRVLNASPFELDACEWPSGFPAAPVRLAPGMSVTADHRADEPTSVTCQMTAPPTRFLDSERPVTVIGSTIVALRLAAGSVQR